jgi:hypothetical protein
MLVEGVFDQKRATSSRTPPDGKPRRDSTDPVTFNARPAVMRIT